MNKRALAKLLRTVAEDTTCRMMGRGGCGDPECSAALAVKAAVELEAEAAEEESRAED